MDIGTGSGVGAASSLVAGANTIGGFAVGTKYKIECVRSGEIAWVEEFPNLVVNNGLKHILRRVGIGETASAFTGGTSTVGDMYPDGRRVPKLWASSTTVTQGALVRASTGDHMFIATTGGTTGGSEPTWNTTLATTSATTTTDNTVTWTEAGRWFIGLIDNASYSAIAAADTMGSHSGWIENYDYSNSIRLPLNLSTSGDQYASITNGFKLTNSSSVAAFSMTPASQVTIKGAFLTDWPTKNTSFGLLYGAGAFGTARAVLSGDTLNVTLEIQVTSV